MSAPPALYWSPTLAALTPDDPTGGLVDNTGTHPFHLREVGLWRPLRELPADARRLIPEPTP